MVDWFLKESTVTAFKMNRYTNFFIMVSFFKTGRSIFKKDQKINQFFFWLYRSSSWFCDANV